MANWCDTTIAFYSAKKSELEALHKTISKLTTEDSWLGNICAYYGFNPEDYSCRSDIYWISEISQDEDSYWYFMIDQSDAWDPHVAVWEDVLDQHYSSIEFVYRSEEPGMGLFQFRF